MRLYTAESQETLRARKLLKEWTDEGLLSGEEYQRLEQETVSELRTTNVFLRGVLFFFTLIVVGAGTGLFIEIFLSRPSDSTLSILFLMLALLCYVAAEMAVAQARLYHHGIEEALVVCSVGFLYAGLQASQSPHAFRSNSAEFLIPGICGILSLWIWHRFGYWYMFLAAMIFAVLLPGYWTSSHSAQHGIVAATFLAGLIVVASAGSGHRFDYLRDAYSLAEALLWGGIYLAINLKISALAVPLHWWDAGADSFYEFGRSFYWLTWVLTWCLPPIVLARGIRQKDRFVIAVGLVVAILTFVTNKPYLGWQRHTWDPMLLGIFLTGAVLLLQRWLARGPGGVREGFTASRTSGRDKSWISVGSGALGLVMPHSITPSPQTINSDLPLRGGESGGAGASRDF
jgi:hypothetical protein